MLKKAENDNSTHLWQTLRDVCARLSIGLRKHILREEQLRGIRDRSLGASASEATNQSLTDHAKDYQFLQVITHCIALEDRPFLLNNRYHLLTGFLRGLRRHMDVQEEELYPVTEQAIAFTEQETLWNK